VNVEATSGPAATNGDIHRVEEQKHRQTLITGEAGLIGSSSKLAQTPAL
jgi:hypothetical protein